VNLTDADLTGASLADTDLQEDGLVQIDQRARSRPGRLARPGPISGT
jgi:hypothetical protein